MPRSARRVSAGRRARRSGSPAHLVCFLHHRHPGTPRTRPGHIQALSSLPRVLGLIAARTGSLMNFAELSRRLAIPQTTLKPYFALLEQREQAREAALNQSGRRWLLLPPLFGKFRCLTICPVSQPARIAMVEGPMLNCSVFSPASIFRSSITALAHNGETCFAHKTDVTGTAWGGARGNHLALKPDPRSQGAGPTQRGRCLFQHSWLSKQPTS